MAKQTSFFDQTDQTNEDLSPSKPVDCHACMDTGKIGYLYCWCVCQASQERSTVFRDALTLSSGTIAGLISNPSYEAIEKAQNEFINWLEDNDQTFKNWRIAWDVFIQGNC